MARYDRFCITKLEKDPPAQGGEGCIAEKDPRTVRWADRHGPPARGGVGEQSGVSLNMLNIHIYTNPFTQNGRIVPTDFIQFCALPNISMSIKKGKSAQNVGKTYLFCVRYIAITMERISKPQHECDAHSTLCHAQYHCLSMIIQALVAFYYVSVF